YILDWLPKIPECHPQPTPKSPIVGYPDVRTDIGLPSLLHEPTPVSVDVPARCTNQIHSSLRIAQSDNCRFYPSPAYPNASRSDKTPHFPGVPSYIPSGRVADCMLL